MLDQILVPCQSDDSEVATATLTERQLAEMTADFADGIRCESEEIEEPVPPTPAPERRTRPEYKSAPAGTVFGVIRPATAPAFLALVEDVTGRPGADVVSVDPATGDVSCVMDIGPEDANDIGNLIADHLASPLPGSVEVEPAGEFFQPYINYTSGTRYKMSALTVSRENAVKYATEFLRAERSTVAGVAVAPEVEWDLGSFVDAGETGRAA